MNIYLEIRKVFERKPERSQRDTKGEKPMYDHTQNSYDRYGNYISEQDDNSNDGHDAGVTWGGSN